MEAMALIMAGGHGLRMRASGVAAPKPLVEVIAVTLLERNIHALLRHGLRRIAVAVPGDVPETAAFLAGRGKAVIEAAGATLEIFVEGAPLGNIGCAGRWRDRARALLVVYADNLTTLDLSAIIAAHGETGADLTLATHMHPFRMPFGEIRSEGGRIVAYVEKPTHWFAVASAISVLGPRALAALPIDRPTGLSELARSLIETGREVREFRHEAAWTDVNDAAALAAAEALVAANQPHFDLWATPPATHFFAGLALADGAAMLVAPSAEQLFWTLPRLSSDASVDASFVFDDLLGSRICRFHVSRVAAVAGGVWRTIADIVADPGVAVAAKRAVAIAA